MRSVQCKSDYPHLSTPREAVARRETELPATVCQHGTATHRNQRCCSPAPFAPFQLAPKFLAPFAWGRIRFCICHASNRGTEMCFRLIRRWLLRSLDGYQNRNNLEAPSQSAICGSLSSGNISTRKEKAVSYAILCSNRRLQRGDANRTMILVGNCSQCGFFSCALRAISIGPEILTHMFGESAKDKKVPKPHFSYTKVQIWTSKMADDEDRGPAPRRSASLVANVSPRRSPGRNLVGADHSLNR